jgi:hypothetical protein
MLVLFAFQIAVHGWTDWTGPVGGPRLRARLLDKEHNSKSRAASVEVEVKNIWLHNPAPTSEYGVVTGVLEYKVDNNPSVVTPDTRLRFEQLSPGNHTITVVTLGVGERPISGKARLVVDIP